MKHVLRHEAVEPGPSASRWVKCSLLGQEMHLWVPGTAGNDRRRWRTGTVDMSDKGEGVRVYGGLPAMQTPAGV